MKTLIVLFLSCLPCLASFTNVVGLEVETNGWVLRATIGGDAAGSIGTNGNFFAGLGANNSLSSTTSLTLTLTSMGYDDAGNGIQVTRSVYGTKILRLVYPMQNTNDIQFQDSGGTNVVFRLALSEFIYSSDSNITATALGGWISGTNGNSTNVAAISSRSVTNSSLAPYPKAIANWSQPGWQRITNSTMQLSAVGFHHSAQSGRPLRAMRFVAQDAHSHTSTNFQTGMTRTMCPLTGCWISEYIGSLDISGFTQGDAIRCDFTAYPWVGDSTAAISTFDNANIQPTPLYSSITNLCDRTGAFGVSYAVVDAVNGGTGLVTTNFVTTQATFATINAAAAAIAASNNIWFSRSDTAAGVIYITNTAVKWTGGSASVGSGTTKTWVTVTPFPGINAASVPITNLANSTDIGGKVHLQNMVITSAASTTFAGMTWLWLDNCLVTNAGTTTFYTIKHWDATDTIFNMAQAIPATLLDTSFALGRGCDISLTNNSTLFYTILGCTKGVTNSSTGQEFVTEQNGQITPNPTGFIWAYNYFPKVNLNGPEFFKSGLNTNNSFGGAIVQNVVERCSGSQPNFSLAADNQTSTIYNNILEWNNTSVGERQNGPYDSVATTFQHVRTYWSFKNNCLDTAAIKTDAFATTSTNIGNWSCVWGCGYSGNVFLDSRFASFGYVGSGGQPGINSFQSASALATTYFKYVNLLAATNDTISSAGGGDYHLQSSSPFIPWNCEWLLPYDIEGNARGLSDPPGAFSSANPRKGGFF